MGMDAKMINLPIHAGTQTAEPVLEEDEEDDDDKLSTSPD